MAHAAYTKLGPATLLWAVWSSASIAVVAGCRSEREAENAVVAEPSPQPAASRAHAPPSASTSKPETLQTASSPRADRTLPNAEATGAESRALSIAVLGDSLSDQRGGGGGYLDVIRQGCPEARIDNFAVGGYMVNQIRRRFTERVLAQPRETYSHVVVFGGVNDLYSDLTAGRTVEKITRDLGFIYEAARRSGARVVAITVTPWGGFTRFYNPRRAAAMQRLNAWILEQAREGRVDVAVDAYPLLSCGNPEKLCPALSAPFRDGLHFGREGQQRLGEALVEAAFPACR